ncbi:MAG: phosphoenolpyruvate--protein phosphotransferase [Desulfurococcaceae archaeon]
MPKVFRGIPVSEGIVASNVVKYSSPAVLLDSIAEADCRAGENEEQRLLNALETFKSYVRGVMEFVDESERELLQAYILMAEALVNECIEIIGSEKVCGELAIKRVYEKYSTMLKSAKSSLIAWREADLREIALSLIKSMISGDSSKVVAELRGKIVISEELTPMAFMELIRAGIRGLVTVRGGHTSHVAILARSHGIPYVVIPSLKIDEIPESARSVLDGFEGTFIVNPDIDVFARYQKKSSTVSRLMDKLRKNALGRARSLDNVEVNVLCNVGDLEEARSALSHGCDGIGLFRVEFLYASGIPPSEDTLFNVLTRVAQMYYEKPVIIRAPDLGADKPLPFLELKEENPALGLRGVRLLLEYREELLKPFLRAFLRALSHHSNLKLLIPMVTKLNEVYDFVGVLESAASESVGASVLSKLEVGVMIETPSAALIVDKLAEAPFVKFASLGTNDLVQYTLAVDRNNPRVSHLYNELEPSVLRLIKQTVDLASRKGLHLEVCGEMASKPMAIPVILSIGIRALSVSPRYVGVVKYIVNNISISRTSENLAFAPDMEDSSKVLEKVREIYREHGLIDLLELYE